jgi:hypothetical protein
VQQWLIIAGIVVVGLFLLSVLFRIIKAATGIIVLILAIWLVYSFAHGLTVNTLLQNVKIWAGNLPSMAQSKAQGMVQSVAQNIAQSVTQNIAQSLKKML